MEALNIDIAGAKSTVDYVANIIRDKLGFRPHYIDFKSISYSQGPVLDTFDITFKNGRTMTINADSNGAYFELLLSTSFDPHGKPDLKGGTIWTITL